MLATKFTYDKIKSNIVDSIKKGLQDTAKDLGTEDYNTDITENIFESLDKIRDEVIDLVHKDRNNLNKAAYRVATANRTEKTRAFNYGVYLLAKKSNKEKLVIYTNSETISDDSSQYLGKELDINQLTYKTLPPYRPNSSLKLKVLNNNKG